jgi:hypothetical protein
MKEGTSTNKDVGAARPFKQPCGRSTFARNDLLFTMSDNTRMPTLRGRSSCMANSCFSYGRAAGDVTAGGARRDRTDDLLLAKQALSQLSYGPAQRSKDPGYPAKAGMVGLGRFELPTSRLSSARSNQLSYRPKKHTLVPRNPKDRGQEGCPNDLG